MTPDGGPGPDPGDRALGSTPSPPRPDGDAPDPPEDTDGAATLELDWPAMLRADLASLVRHGHLPRAAREVVRIRPGFDALVLDPLWVELRAEGYDAEVAVLAVVRRRPDLVALVGRAQRAGWIAGGVVLVVLLYPLWFLAIASVVPARVLVTTLHLRLSAPRRLRHLPPTERPAALAYFDVAASHALATRRYGQTKAAASVALGVAFYVLLVAISAKLDPLFVVSATAFCALQIATGVVLVAAARRARRFGFHDHPDPPVLPSSIVVRPSPSERSGAPIVRPTVGAGSAEAAAAGGLPASPPTWPAALVPLPALVAFTRPRLQFAGLPALVFAMAAVMASRDHSAVGWAIAVPSAVVAALVVVRAWHTEVVITPDGIVDVGIVRTRRYGWDDIAALRLVNEPGNQIDGMHLITAGGRDRLLVTNVAVRGARPDLVRLCEVVTAHGHATAPPRVERPRWSSIGGAIALGLCGTFLALMALAGLFGGGHASLPVEQVPAGRVYYRYVRPDGSLSQASVECPPLASWVAGGRDPLCGDPTRAAAIFVAVMGSLAAAFLAGAVAMARRWRRWRRCRLELVASVGLAGVR